MLRAAAFYVLLVYAAGFVLGPIRVLVLEPRLGSLGAVLAEAPLMLAAIAAAGVLLARKGVTPPTAAGRFGMGLLAGAALAVLELAGAALLRGVSPGAYVAGLASPPGLVFLVLVGAFMAWPALLGAAADARRGRRP